MNIKFVNYKDIDLEKWDNAINQSVNGLVYANSWYLNIVSPDWTALIAGDYDIVMPLTFKKKYGINYLYNPFFCQFLGVFYKDEKCAYLVKRFIDEASKYYKFIELNINVSNSDFNADYCTLKQTQVLSLSNDYELIKGNYSKSNKKNIRKANNKNLTIEKSNDYTALISLIKLTYKDKKEIKATKKKIRNLEEIVEYTLNHGMGEIYYAYYNGSICAAAFFLKWGDRVILKTGANDIGKKTCAIFKILNDHIQRNAGSKLLLDFAGSNIPGVAYRNRGFGAITQNYYSIRINNLPRVIKWIKK